MKQEIIIKPQKYPEVLLVIGNGFDLQCGLKTTYYDFLLYILRKNYKTDIEDHRLLEIYEEDIYNSHKYFDINPYKNTSNNNLVLGKLNIWYIIFLYKRIIGKKDWNLIENQIMYSVLKDSVGLDISVKVLVGLLRKKNYTYATQYIDFNYNKKFIVMDENIYNVLAYNIYKKAYSKEEYIDISYQNLKRQLDEWDKNTNKIIAQEAYNLNNSKQKIDVDSMELTELIECVSEVLLSELRELESDFIAYMNEQVTSNDYIDNSKLLLNVLVKTTRLPNINIVFNMISFNYTTPWENFSENEKPYLGINIHGSLKENNIIFGIDENKIDVSNSGYKFTKVSRMIELSSKRSDKPISIDSILSKEITCIVFYGHSLSEADYGYFRLIFDEYVESEDVSFEFCYSVYEGTTEENEIRKLRTGISRLFGMYSKEKNIHYNVLNTLNLNNRIKFRKIDSFDKK